MSERTRLPPSRHAFTRCRNSPISASAPSPRCEKLLKRAVFHSTVSAPPIGFAKTISTPTSRPHAALPRSYSAASSMPSWMQLPN